MSLSTMHGVNTKGVGNYCSSDVGLVEGKSRLTPPLPRHACFKGRQCRSHPESGPRAQRPPDYSTASLHPATAVEGRLLRIGRLGRLRPIRSYRIAPSPRLLLPLRSARGGSPPHLHSARIVGARSEGRCVPCETTSPPPPTSITR